MDRIEAGYGRWLDASSQYAHREEIYHEQVGKTASPDGSLESLAKYALVPNAEPTLPMLFQLMGLDQQLATSSFKQLKGYQELQGQARQPNRLGSIEERKKMLSQIEDKDVSAALELTIRDDEMRLVVQGEMGSLVAA